MGNVHGRMTGLTLFTPIRPQWVWLLRLGLPLTRHLPFMARHILQFNFIKFVRWTIVPSLDGERLHYPYLFFESNFDIPWRQYIDAFAYVIPKDIRVIWGRGFSFPGPPPAEPLKRWIAMNSLEGGHYHSAYPQASVKMTLAAFEAHDRLLRLKREAAGLSPEQFRKAFDAAVADLQRHL